MFPRPDPTAPQSRRRGLYSAAPYGAGPPVAPGLAPKNVLLHPLAFRFSHDRPLRAMIVVVVFLCPLALCSPSGTSGMHQPPKKVETSPALGFLPMSRAEMERLGWKELDVLLVSGDAYVDHPAFGAALLGRWLAAHGFRVGIVAQPRWDRTEDFEKLGRPRLFAGVTAGALDSMLAHYTAFRKKRHADSYTPGGLPDARPNRATLVYTNLVRQAFPGLPVVIGGIEASTRRASHYDFWMDKVRRSILLDSKANLLVYGMAERAILEVARRVAARMAANAECRMPNAESMPNAECPMPNAEEKGRRPPKGGIPNRRPPEGGTPSEEPPEAGTPYLGGIPGTVFVGEVPEGAEAWRLPSHEETLADPAKLMEATLLLERQVHSETAWATQSAEGRTVVFAPPAKPLSTEELDALYSLPFSRRPHPSYQQPIPAVEMIQFSVTTHRGCAGGCSFCSLALHQGRRIRSRSRDSILAEVGRLTEHPDWKGSLSDVGGATANLWQATCLLRPGAATECQMPDAKCQIGKEEQEAPEHRTPNAENRLDGCQRESCLWPEVCRHFKAGQKALAELLRAIARVPKVKHVRTASGVRHDVAMLDEGYVRALVGEFVGGQLKLAPEHCSRQVLRLMRKSGFEKFEEFLTVFEQISREAGKEQYVIPYLMSAFPGCTDANMRELAAWLNRRGWKPQQVQCFVPTPGTVATAMYYAGIDPQGKPIHVAKSDAQRLKQHGILIPASPEGKGKPPRKRTRPP